MSHEFTYGQRDVLDALATYRYLTAQHFVDLSISANVESAQRNLINPLINRRPALIKKWNYRRKYRFGPYPLVYSLTKRGARRLDQLGDLPIGTTRHAPDASDWVKEYDHRMSICTFHVQFRQWADGINAQIPVALLDFDRSLKSPTGKPRKDTLIPPSKNRADPTFADAIFALEIGDYKRLYALEIHNDPHAKKITDQLLDHYIAYEDGALAKRLDMPISPFVLSVHVTRYTDNGEPLSTVQSVRERLAVTEFARNYPKTVLFNETANLKKDINYGWTTVDGAAANPFPNI